MLMELLEHYAMGVKKPRRIVISRNPVHAVCLKRARWAGVTYDMVLVRKDGWSIGFHHQWRDEVYALHPDDWEAVCDLVAQTVIRIATPKREGDR